MKIAILGATSFIAQELVREWVCCSTVHELHLYARDQEKVSVFLNELNLEDVTIISICLSSFPSEYNYDVVINFIGVGDPAKTKVVFSNIMHITEYYDDLVLAYLEKSINCRYIFLSSGAVYGNDFSQPATEKKLATFNINADVIEERYGLAKFRSEMKHRCLSHLSIVDVRVFNFFSRNQDLGARFFIADLLRSIELNLTCKVNPEPLVRDYLHPADFKQIIECLLNSPKMNIAVDCYSAGEVDKMSLLSELEYRFGLKYDLVEKINFISPTGNKVNYFSKNNKLAEFGYKPRFTSLENIIMESEAILTRKHVKRVV